MSMHLSCLQLFLAIAVAALALLGGASRAQDTTTTAPSVMDATAEVKAKSYVQQTTVDDLFAAVDRLFGQKVCQVR